MTERPIPLKAWEVRAILDGRKTQTRRIACKGTIPGCYVTSREYEPGRFRLFSSEPPEISRNQYTMPRCPHGAPGDRLWVRESLRYDAEYGHYYAATREPSLGNAQGRDWLHCYFEDGYNDLSLPDRSVPSIHMPRWASRIMLEVTGVRVERLQEISRGDAMEEGCPFPNMKHGDDPRQWYRDLWEPINGPRGWGANPWVWVISFRRIES
jgi:hypothetical protein